MNKTIMITGAVFGFLAVALGAFGAHGIKGLIDATALEMYHTGVKYQMYHALLLLVLGNLNGIPAQAKKWVFYAITAGIICFSFSLYLLAFNSLTGFDFGRFGFITPIGGLFLLSGWILMGYRVFKHFT